MTKTVKIRERDADTINELVEDPHDELTWAEKVNEVVTMAYEYECRGSDVL